MESVIKQKYNREIRKNKKMQEESTTVDQVHKKVYEKLVEKLNKNIEMSDKLAALDQELDKEFVKSTQMNDSIIDALYEFDTNLELNPYNPDNIDFIHKKLQLILERDPSLKDTVMADSLSEVAEFTNTLKNWAPLSSIKNCASLELWLQKNHPQIYQQIRTNNEDSTSEVKLK